MGSHPKPAGRRAGARQADKREEILVATWRLIAEQGLRAANMRALAAAAGYANGALSYYFDSKEDLLRAAFSHVFERTERRIAEATRGKRGLGALRAMCQEILPGDGEKLLEARIVLPFWAEAAQDATFADLHERALQTWRTKLKRHLREAEADGEARKLTARELNAALEQLLTLLMGAQVMGVLSPEVHVPAMLHAMVEHFVGRIGNT